MDEIKSPLKAIRAFCLDCCGGNANFVKECASKTCSLKSFRFGKNPYAKREMSEEQRMAARERMKNARKAKEQEQYL